MSIERPESKTTMPLAGRRITYVIENGDHVGENIRQQMRAARDLGAQLTACCLSGTGHSLSAGREADALDTLDLAPEQLDGARLGAIRRFRKHLREYPCDTLVCEQYKSITTAAIATSIPGCPSPRLIALLRGFSAAQSPSRRRFYHLFARRIQGFITLTEAQKSHILELMPWFRDDSFHVVNNYLDTDRLRASMLSRDEALEALGLGNGPFTFGTISRFDSIKRLTDLVAAAQILHERGASFRVIIVGDGRERAAIRRQVEEAGMTNQVFLTGSTPNAARYMMAFDTFVLPSEGDNFARVFLEARAANLPLVGVAGGGTPEVIGQYGWICSARAPRNLANTLETILGISEAELRAAGEAGTAWSNSYFTRNRMQQQLRLALEAQ